jgi:DNA-binding MarR family transcriptional regulator
MRRTIASAVLYSHHVAEQVGLGPSDSQFLMLLEMHGPLTPGQLAMFSGLKTGTVTGVIDRLEKLGLTKRERDPDDRRKVIVSRNEDKVQELMGPHYAPKGDGLMKVLDGFTRAELKTIAEFLNKLSQ